MANYPILAPTLAALGGTYSDPADAEDASKLAAVDRQTRTWIYQYLSQYFDASGLKSAAFNAGTSMPVGFVHGTEPSTGAQREIAQASILEQDLANGAVIERCIYDGAVTAAKISPASITGAQMADRAIDRAALIADGVIQDKHLGVNSLDGNAIKAGTIPSGKFFPGAIQQGDVGDNALEGSELVTADAGYVLVGGNTVNGVPNCLAPKKLSGAIEIDAEGVVTFLAGTGSGIARIIEQTPAKTGGGSGTALVWNTRGLKAQWVLDPRCSNGDVAAPDQKSTDKPVIRIKKNGMYLVIASAPAYMTSEHQIRLTIKPDGKSSSEYIVMGTSESSGNGGNYAATRSWIFTVVSVINAEETDYPYLFMEHYITFAAGGNNTLGPASAVDTRNDKQIFADVVLIKIG